MKQRVHQDLLMSFEPGAENFITKISKGINFEKLAVVIEVYC